MRGTGIIHPGKGIRNEAVCIIKGQRLLEVRVRDGTHISGGDRPCGVSVVAGDKNDCLMLPLDDPHSNRLKEL